MARTVAEIQKQQYDTLASEQALGNLPNLNPVSQAGNSRSWIFIVAVAIAYFEQVLDGFMAAFEAKVATLPFGSLAWISQKVVEFQSDPSGSTNTNVVIVKSDLTIGYPTVDPAFRIITRNAIVPDANKNIIVKVAKGTTPVPLSVGEINRLDSYLTAILPAGVTHSVYSAASDFLAVYANIYYKGEYGQTIKSLVETAINNYLLGIPFNGQLKISDLEFAIKQMPEVNDVEILKVLCRANGTAIGSATAVYNTSPYANLLVWNTVAGYIEEETTGGYTFADTITYNAQ